MTNNPISFRVPPNLRGKVHPDAEEAIQNHDNAIVDLQQANASLKSQLTEMQQQIATLQKGK